MDEQQVEPELVELAAAYGVATDYWDWRGVHRPVPRATIAAVLGALDVEVPDAEASRAALAELRNRSRRTLLPDCVTLREGEAGRVLVHVRHGDPVEVAIELEDGTVRVAAQEHHLRGPEEVDGELWGEAAFALPADLPCGYHKLRATTRSAGGQGTGAPETGGTTTATGHLIVTPDRVDLEARLGERQWGFAAQLYSVRSRASWAMGDLADLAELARWSGGLGAGYLLVNPLHAGEPVPPLEPSPYLPTTRRYASPLYLRVEDVPEYAELDEADRARLDALAAPLRARATDAELLDRDAVWRAKLAAAELLHGVRRAPERDAAYRGFCDREGQALTDFATWCVLAELHGADWHAWPAELRDPRSSAVAAAREEYADRVDLYRYLQWLLDDQLAAAQRAAADAGMGLGVVHDLPVGVHPLGADAWALRDVLASGVSVGAPPDAFNQLGQDWSQPPWRPDRLAETGYAPWRELVRGVLRHGRGLRIDHVMGLFRLWWVPEGAAPLDGTYVRYDHAAMVGVLVLEAERAGAVLIGEDLGTVEPWAREHLDERGILGTNVAWFEYADDGRPRPPEDWRRDALATVTVHDLPPTGAQLDGAHIRLRAELGVLTRPVEEEWAAFEAERAGWLRRLDERGLLPDGYAAERDGALSADRIADVVAAMHRWVAATPARLVGVALPDAVGDRRTQNQPGTHREYPNWRIPLCDAAGRPVLVKDLPDLSSVAALVAAIRGR